MPTATSHTRTQTIEVTTYNFTGLTETQINVLKKTIKDRLFDLDREDYGYRELTELQEALEKMDKEDDGYWGR